MPKGRRQLDEIIMPEDANMWDQASDGVEEVRQAVSEIPKIHVTDEEPSWSPGDFWYQVVEVDDEVDAVLADQGSDVHQVSSGSGIETAKGLDRDDKTAG